MGPEILSQGLLSQGFQLMLIGMGTVFSFLVFLVLITLLMSKMIRSFEPRRGAYAQMAEKFNIDESHVEAISVALELHVARGECKNG